MQTKRKSGYLIRLCFVKFVMSGFKFAVCTFTVAVFTVLVVHVDAISCYNGRNNGTTDTVKIFDDCSYCYLTTIKRLTDTETTKPITTQLCMHFPGLRVMDLNKCQHISRGNTTVEIYWCDRDLCNESCDKADGVIFSDSF
uniref:Protein quiver n=1 Tax=Panagrellus redivivus TaxID=6233 RepID=A0A7E4V7Z3_PANRE